jgi:hypothetical protein
MEREKKERVTAVNKVN